MTEHCLFDRLDWRDPITGHSLVPIVQTRNPVGLPMYGALRVASTTYGYPIVDGVVRITPELATRYAAWLEPLGLQPPPSTTPLQTEDTVDSFGFQWMWAGTMRSESDLRWRVADRFGMQPSSFRGHLVMDAGAGTGDQSGFLLRNGACVVSVDLSSAIELVGSKHRLNPNWIGLQGDLAALPFGDASFGLIYCEGVIQHTADSAATVAELCRLLQPGGLILATHYSIPERWLSRMKLAYTSAIRKRLSQFDRYKLLLICGLLAATAYLPGVGRLVRASGTATHSDLMPDFRTTWINTFDMFGNQFFQRRVSGHEFWTYFERTGLVERAGGEGAVVLARRHPCT